MAITDAQKQAARKRQVQAASDGSTRIRLVAGPGTGKSHTIEERVRYVLDSGAAADEVYVISFTRASCDELRTRIAQTLSSSQHSSVILDLNVSTMHSLALRILRRAQLLNQYPSDPRVLDRWEQAQIYDSEFSRVLGKPRTRAAQIRLAHDARWQTLDPASMAQARITPPEKATFNAFHGTRTNLYSCVLPGEVIYRCVENLKLGNIPPDALPTIQHLVVDEFQDLNRCDQEFICLLCQRGAILFVAGDDDQSIYSFRHADPSGIVDFTTRYSGAASHELTDCFRCAPNILTPALRLIEHNPNRIQKNLRAVYAQATPPVHGSLMVWSFPTAAHEARAIAESCQQLIAAGMAGTEEQILILLAQLNPSAVQLDPITQALANLGIPYAEPAGAALTEDPAIRAVYSLLRLVKDTENDEPDYIAPRTLLALLYGVGPTTLMRIAEGTVSQRANFHDLFYEPSIPNWLSGNEKKAVDRIRSIIAKLGPWSLSDTLAARLNDIGSVLSQDIFTAPAQSSEHLATWLAFARNLPQEMTLDELYEYLGALNSEQQAVLDRVYARLGGTGPSPLDSSKKVRILTMHGAKGLSGKVVFIPSAAQGIMPSARAIRAPGLLIEQRRLFYVSITRAMAACIVSHSVRLTGAAAQAIAQRSSVRLSRSQFLNEMNVTSVSRTTGLRPSEAQQILADIREL